MLFGYNMSYGYRVAAPGYAAGCATACAPRVAMAAPCPPRDPCAIPQHTDAIQVPHHVYTLHSQPIVRKWVEHRVEMRTVPVTQEQQVTSHPPQEYCTAAPQPCAPSACAPRAAAAVYRY